MAIRKKAPGKKKASNRSSGKAKKKVQRSVEEMKEGELRSGRAGKKVRSRKQAVAIGLSEARAEGADVPPRKKSAKKDPGKAAKKGSKKRGGR
jgi:Family of unknown function (DUF6496)